MTRPVAAAAALAFATILVVTMNAACAADGSPAGDPSGNGPTTSGPTTSGAATGPAASGAATKLAPQLSAALPRLPADQPVRLIARLDPGTATESLRGHVERLGGRLLQRFTIIEAAVVVVPGRSVLRLAELQEVRGLELADSGEPPPS
jgi:hypothetical protein